MDDLNLLVLQWKPHANRFRGGPRTIWRRIIYLLKNREDHFPATSNPASNPNIG